MYSFFRGLLRSTINAVDHTEIYQRVAGKYGAIPQIAYRSTYNVKNKQHFAFADFWARFTIALSSGLYWAKVGMPLGPGHYGSLYGGSKRLRDEFHIPCTAWLTRPRWKAISPSTPCSTRFVRGYSLATTRWFSIEMCSRESP